MTPFVAANVYFRQREDSGALKLPESIVPIKTSNEYELFLTWARLKKLQPWQIARLWAAHKKGT